MKKALIGLLVAFGVLFSSAAVFYLVFPGACLGALTQAARWSAGVSRHEIQVDDHRWVYLEGGTGDVMLFVHGYGANKDFWGDMVKAFSGSYRVIVPDVPGFGENSQVKGDRYDIPSQAQRLDRFADALGLASFHLNGYSMGGGIAAWYAGEHPEKVKSLLLLGPFGVRNEKPTAAIIDYEKDRTEALYFKTEKGYRHVQYLAFDNPPQLPGRFLDVIVEEGKKNYSFHRKIFEDLWNGGLGVLEPRLVKITAPTLIIWGKNDRIFLASSAAVFKRGIKNSRTEVLDGGHMIFMDAPVRTIGLYRDFLNNLK